MTFRPEVVILNKEDIAFYASSTENLAQPTTKFYISMPLHIPISGPQSRFRPLPYFREIWKEPQPQGRLSVGGGLL
jgi:hypothetical protein